MKLSFEIIPEDYDKHLYSVEWTDTLGQAGGYKVTNRPEELWCVITNRNQDTLGYYIGLSSSRTFADFQSDDTLVMLNFSIHINIFSEAFNIDKRIRNEYFGKDSIPKEFEPVAVNLKKDLRKKITMVLTER